MADDGRQGFDVRAVLQGMGCEGMPLWHNKDKLDNPLQRNGLAVCLYSFSTKKMALKRCLREGGEKTGLHFNDKFS